jgi:hypothetical protein
VMEVVRLDEVAISVASNKLISAASVSTFRGMKTSKARSSKAVSERFST